MIVRMKPARCNAGSMKRIRRFYLIRSLCPTDWKPLLMPMIAIRIATFVRPKGGYVMKRALICSIGVTALIAGVQDVYAQARPAGERRLGMVLQRRPGSPRQYVRGRCRHQSRLRLSETLPGPASARPPARPGWHARV